ncbi:MAG: bifunctional hydroxymethylpyrimidine kinase/phosphomethylpyrimidine kinase [Promethearchaeia archaeon]
MTLHYALTIAGSDPSCGAGVQADIRTFDRCGVYPLSAITALTSQSAKEFYGYKSASSELKSQLTGVLENYPVQAVKIGMIPDQKCIKIIKKALKQYNLLAVLDPLTIASAGKRLAEKNLEQKIKSQLFPYIAILTPNVSEAEVYSGISLTKKETYSFQRLKKAAERILEQMNAKNKSVKREKAVIIKSGYGNDSNLIDLCLLQRKKNGSFTREFLIFRKKELKVTGNVHGTGCVFSSAIAAHLAQDLSIQEAIKKAETFFDERFPKYIDLADDSKVMDLGFSKEQINVMNKVKKIYNFISDKREFSKFIPEVRLNISGALPEAKNKKEVAAVEGRITIINGYPHAVGQIRFGVSDHTARLILMAKKFDKSINFVMNLRYKEHYIKMIKENTELSLYEFKRESQPEIMQKKEHSTMQWIIKRSMDETGRIPDIIWDKGGIGKEPMIRVFAINADKMIKKIEIILNALSHFSGKIT